MSGNSVLSRLRRSRWRRLAIALFAVPAILIGLLAMHVLTSDGMTESAAVHPMSSGHTTDTALVHGADEAMVSSMSPGLPAPAEGCGGLCGPGHDMLGMICVLALLVTVVLLSLHLILIRWEEVRHIVSTLAAKAAALAPPAPPSLHVLSISRT